MRLTRFTDYALRVLIFVAKERDRTCTMGEVAEFYEISQEHLRKVVHKLVKCGYLKSSRGRGGGIVLARDPDTLRIGDVIVAMEEDLDIIPCQNLGCVLLPDCSLQKVLGRGVRAFVDAMNEFTLADLLSDRAMQRQFGRIAQS